MPTWASPALARGYTSREQGSARNGARQRPCFPASSSTTSPTSSSIGNARRHPSKAEKANSVSSADSKASAALAARAALTDSMVHLRTALPEADRTDGGALVRAARARAARRATGVMALAVSERLAPAVMITALIPIIRSMMTITRPLAPHPLADPRTRARVRGAGHMTVRRMISVRVNLPTALRAALPMGLLDLPTVRAIPVAAVPLISDTAPLRKAPRIALGVRVTATPDPAAPDPTARAPRAMARSRRAASRAKRRAQARRPLPPVRPRPATA